MPFMFALLVIANAALFGYFILVQDDKIDLSKEQAELSQPIDFENTSKSMEPIIGTEK